MVAVTGMKIWSVAIVLGFLFVPNVRPPVRAEVLSLRDRPFITPRAAPEPVTEQSCSATYAQCHDAGIVQVSIALGHGAILLDRGLSFNRRGVRMPAPDGASWSVPAHSR